MLTKDQITVTIGLNENIGQATTLFRFPPGWVEWMDDGEFTAEIDGDHVEGYCGDMDGIVNSVIRMVNTGE